MDTEYELRTLEVDVLSYKEKIKNLVVVKVFDTLQKKIYI